MNYIVVSNTNLIALMMEVNQMMLDDDYKPLGGIAFCPVTNCYLQAMA